MRQFTIGQTVITDASPCFVIAEIGGNHGGNVQTAVDMIRIAKAAGADAVKFQCRDNETLYSDTLLNAAYENEHSYGKTYGEHRKALELSDAALDVCMFEAERSNVLCFSTAFDELSVDRIVNLGMPAIKIASGGLTDKRLLRHAALSGLPIILSTGGGTFREIDEAVELVTCYTHRLALLHCVASYPVRNYAEHNLRCITAMRERYPELVIGWSSHDSGIAMGVAAYTLGARIIETHFTLNRANKGTDNSFSLEPAGLGKLVRDLTRARAALGNGEKRYLPSEVAPISKMRRREQPDGSWKIDGTKDETDPTLPAA